MISVSEAKEIIQKNVVALQPATVRLQDAAGKILADDVYAAFEIPAFPQSSMDGYAFAYADWKQQKLLKVEGESVAGNDEQMQVKAGQAVRVFTGAPVPDGADTVVMQEKIKLQDGLLNIIDEELKKGNNVRPKGSEIKAGELALEKGCILTAGTIGFLAGIGIQHVKISPDPLISIIITGKELQQPGTILHYGQVYDSNSFGLSAALQKTGISHFKIYHCDDHPEELANLLKSVLKESDIVLLTGGVSVGDYDFVLQATMQCGVEKLFHKIRQRPGKPLYFGKKENKIVFGLPGNPSSVLTCFYEYVLPAIAGMNKRPLALQRKIIPLETSFSKTNPLVNFLKGYYNGETVRSLDAQESYRLSSFAKANCLIKLDEGIKIYVEGDTVEIHLLPV